MLISFVHHMLILRIVTMGSQVFMLISFSCNFLEPSSYGLRFSCNGSLLKKFSLKMQCKVCDSCCFTFGRI